MAIATLPRPPVLYPDSSLPGVAPQFEELKRQLRQHIEREVGHNILIGYHRWYYMTSPAGVPVVQYYRIFTNENENIMKYEEEHFYSGDLHMGYRVKYRDVVTGRTWKALGVTFTYDYSLTPTGLQSSMLVKEITIG